MKRIVYKNEFIEDLLHSDHRWSLEGADFLYEYLSQLEEDLNEEILFDLVIITTM